MVCDREALEREALNFTQKPYALNFYPHGEGKAHENAPVEISDDKITLSCFRKSDDETFMIRLFNNFDADKKCSCRVFDKSVDLEFGKYEVKTLLYKSGKLYESDSMLDI